MMNSTQKTCFKELEKLQFQIYNEIKHLSNLTDEIIESIHNPQDVDFDDLKLRLIAKISILNTKTTIPRKCKCCGNAVNGRKDKVFCTIACKTNYHNILNREVLKVAAKTNSQLRRNHAILLDKTILQQKTKVAQVELEIVGFNFDFYTGICHDKSKRLKSIRIYDFILTKTETGIFEISKLKQPQIHTASRPLKTINMSNEIRSFINKQFIKAHNSFINNQIHD